jgi:hypothetical protein
MIGSHKVLRKERLMVDLGLKFPNPHHNKSYEDERRHYSVKVDLEEPQKVTTEGVLDMRVKLRSLISVKKMFGKKIDSSMTYRVGENFALLRIGVHELRISMSFEEDNILDIFDNSMHIQQSRILETKDLSKDEK